MVLALRPLPLLLALLLALGLLPLPVRLMAGAQGLGGVLAVGLAGGALPRLLQWRQH